MRGVNSICGLLLICLIGATSAKADEPAKQFLDALRENGFYDVALDYLDSIENSDLIGDDFRESLSFERAETLISSVGNLRDLKLIDQRLDAAQKLLTEYADSNASLQVSAKTKQYSGRLLSQRADIYLRQSESERLTVGERDQLFGKARTMLEGAVSNITQAKELLKRLLDPSSPDAIKIDPDDPSTLENRKQLQEAYTRVTVQLPNVTEKLADTYPEGDATRTQLLSDAVESYMKVWGTYKRYAAGIQACVFAGRCNQKLGKHKEALERFSEVFALGSGGPLKQFKKQAYVLATDSWRKQSPYPYKEVIFILDPVVRGLSRLETREPDWLKVQLELAVAKYSKAAEVKEAGGPTANSDAKTMERAAAKALRNVARVPSKYRDEAKQLLSQWNVSLKDIVEETTTPTNFADALQLGRDQIAEVESIAAEVEQLRKNAAAAKDAAGKTDLEQQLAEAQENLMTESNRAIQTLDSAMSMADPQTSRGDINTARYLQSYAYFASGRILETTVIGQFLLNKYPREDGTKPASGLMVQSYSRLLDQAQPADREFEKQNLTSACNEIINRWPGSNEAGMAAATMTRLALVDNDFKLANTYYVKVPVDYGSRGPLALRLGQTMWLDYKQQVRANANSTNQPELKQQLELACQLMHEGVKALAPDQVRYDDAVGMLMLVDANLKRGDTQAAIELLDQKDGPLDLLKRQVPSVTQGPKGNLYVRETYKIAIKAFLAGMRVDIQQQARWIDRINGVLAAMKQEVQSSQDPKDKARLAGVYQLIAAELKSGFDELTDVEQKKTYAKTLAKFLGSVEQSSNDGKTVLWAGSTLMSIANNLAEQGLTDQSGVVFAQATSAFSRAESIGFEQESNPEALKTELRRQRALALRGSGQYQQAVDEFIAILKSGRSSLSYQIDAADTLQQWGLKKGLSDPLAEATGGKGDMVDPKTNRKTKAIWGWKKIVLATRSNDKFRDTYYLALYKLIEGRFEYGKIKNRKEVVASSLRELKKEQARDGSFRGMQSWKSKYAALQKRIEAELN